VTAFLSACEATYPAATLTTTLTKLIKTEVNVDVISQVVGKTLWIYFPSEKLVNAKDLMWDETGLEDVGKVLSVAHRVLLSSDASIDFVSVVAADVKNYGLELQTIEYVPDIKEAILERFSRGEFFMRSVRDVSLNPQTVNDRTAESKRFYDISFDQFLSQQIIHRVKSLFLKDKRLEKIYEIKSTGWSQKFGVLKIDFEFMKKRYDLTPEEEAIKPLDFVVMIAAKVINTYHYNNQMQAIELTDTFTKETKKLTSEELKKVKINLPEFLD
jgi:hypothetical protein